MGCKCNSSWKLLHSPQLRRQHHHILITWEDLQEGVQKSLQENDSKHCSTIDSCAFCRSCGNTGLTLMQWIFWMKREVRQTGWILGRDKRCSPTGEVFSEEYVSGRLILHKELLWLKLSKKISLTSQSFTMFVSIAFDVAVIIFSVMSLRTNFL